MNKQAILIILITTNILGYQSIAESIDTTNDKAVESLVYASPPVLPVSVLKKMIKTGSIGDSTTAARLSQGNTVMLDSKFFANSKTEDDTEVAQIAQQLVAGEVSNIIELEYESEVYKIKCTNVSKSANGDALIVGELIDKHSGDAIIISDGTCEFYELILNGEPSISWTKE